MIRILDRLTNINIKCIVIQGEKMNEDKTTTAFGLKLKKLREKMGLTQIQISEKIDIPSFTYSRYERGNREPNYATLKRIANFYDVTIDYLLSNNEAAIKRAQTIDLEEFIMKGNYTVNENFPDDLDRETIRDILQAIYRKKK